MIPWLPAPGEGDVERAVCKLVSRWLATWLVDVPAISCVLARRGAFVPARWIGPAAVMAGPAEGCAAALGLGACRNSADLRNPRDRELLTGLGDTMLDHLAELLTQVVGTQKTDPAFASESDWLVVKPADDAWSIVLSIDAAGLVCLRRDAAGTVRSPQLGRIRDAIAGETAAFGCYLGRATLTAAELGALAIGDVIRFDRKVTSTLSVLINNVPASAGTVQVVTDGDNLSVVVASPLELIKN